MEASTVKIMCRRSLVVDHAFCRLPEHVYVAAV